MFAEMSNSGLGVKQNYWGEGGGVDHVKIVASTVPGSVLFPLLAPF